MNLDNNYTANCQANGNLCYFTYSLVKPENVTEAVFCDGSQILYTKDGSTETILSVSDILLPGKHNVENYMAAIAAVINLVQPSAILQIAKTFGGVEHRIELCRVLDGVKYYNSSIDSSPSRSMAALRAFDQKVIMIAGGYDKNLDYTALGDEICKRVKTLVLCGATSSKIKSAVLSSKFYDSKSINIIDCKSFNDTARIAKAEAKDGDVVILSPASASFDLFKNFEERGKLFKNLVSEL